jgi:hypothetical protein
MRAIPPIGVSLVDESKVRLVNEGGGLKDVPRRFVPKPVRRAAAQFLVDHRDELVSRSEISAAPRVQESSHVVVGTAQMVLRCRPS